MARIIRKNQEHNPIPKKNRVDDKGNDTRRCFVKSGNTTMLFFKATDNGCEALCQAIYSYAEKLGIKIETSFLVTR